MPGLYVPKETVDACIRYVKQSQNADGGFRYMLQGGRTARFRDRPPEWSHSRAPASTIPRRSATGSPISERFTRGIKLGESHNHYFYGQYYAAQAMWLRGGDDWAEWYPAIRNELLDRQSAPGFWTDSVCNEYGTAMALIILQIPNNYLPIFQR